MAETRTMGQTTPEARKAEPTLTLSRSFQASLEFCQSGLEPLQVLTQSLVFLYQTPHQG